jgi:hypothetical protein
MDTCTLQRPLDTRTHIRIALEAEAAIGLIGLVESGVIELVSSYYTSNLQIRAVSPIELIEELNQ